MANAFPRRKSNRLPLPSYRGIRCYFVTICCRERRPFFAREELARKLALVLRDACARHGFGIHAYCFMPDHFHVLLIGNAPTADLLLAVRNFKGAATACARHLGISMLWQKGFYDHVIRSEESLNRAAWYILMNPVRAGLVTKAAEWPFSDWAVTGWRAVVPTTEAYLPPWKRSV
ncbi:MAG: REP-associated tyrosine transposase [Candidatus Acidiferrales bacterium]